jgi:putative DNA primase/helicase
MEIWFELFQGETRQLTPLMLKELHDIMKKMEGWESYSKGSGKLRFGSIYGKQKVYLRVKEDLGEAVS